MLRKKISRPLLCLSFSLPAFVWSGPVNASIVNVFDASTGVAESSEAKETISNDEPINTIYDDGKRGWYWYEIEPEEPEELEEDEDKQPWEFIVDDYSYEELWNMYPVEFQELVKHRMNVAVQSPTEENVEEYLIIQDIARRKSVAFASAVGYVRQMHPELGNSDVHPITSPGRRALVQIKQEEVNETIQESSDEFALIMFTQDNCKFCDAQKSILNFLTMRYAWNVRYVDINENPGISRKFGIEQTPSIILVHRDSQDHLPISVGVQSLPTIAKRIYRSIRFFHGEITMEQWYLHDFKKNTGGDPLKFIESKK